MEERTGLSEKLKDKVYKLFYAMDTNKDDAVILKEWRVKAKELDPYVTDEVIQSEFEMRDTNDNGSLDLSEFK